MASSLAFFRYRLRMWWWRLPGRTKLGLILIPQVLLLVWFLFFSSPAPVTWDEPTMKDIPRLLEWAKEAGLITPKIDIVMTWKGKTMIALEDIPPGDLFRVPYSMLLCSYLNRSPHVMDNPAWKLISALDFNSHWTEALLMLAEKQRGDSAWFAPYLTTLTKREDLSLPLFWTDSKEIEAIEGTSLRRWLVDATRVEFDQYWPNVEKLIRDNPDVLDPNVFTYRNFEWASSLIWSHAFNTWRGNIQFATAVPVVDLVNHDNTMNTWWEIEDETSYWVLKTETPFSRGEEIRISYGDMPNVRLMKWFGFAVDGNTDDAFYFELPLRPDDPNLRTKQSFMDSIGYDWIEVVASKWPSKLMAAARIAELSQEDFDSKYLRNTEKSREPPWMKISCANEIAALKYILEKIREYESEYTTTIAEDQALLKKTDLSKNMRHAIILRKGHKIIFDSLKTKTLNRLKDEQEICQSE